MTKLAHYGIRRVAFKLLSSYLSGRQQYVNFKQTKSNDKEIKYEVPQESFLGPLLFLIYVNDLPNSVNCTPRLYADDTCLIACNPVSLQNLINSELNELDPWCCSNKLTVNPSKSNIIFIFPKFVQNSNDNYNMTFADSFIATVPNSKYLGVIIDNNSLFMNT